MPEVHRLGSPMVNWYLVEDGGRLTAVDSGLPAFERTLDEDLARIGRNRGDVEAVVLTHSDGDHTSLAPIFREAGARVLIHALDEPALVKPGPKKGEASPRHLLAQVWRPKFLRFMAHMARNGGAKPPAIEGAETFGDGDELDVPGRPRVVHTPGHTAGHCAFLFDGALFAGDELCTWNPMTGALGPQLMPGPTNESNADCLASLDAIARQDAAALYPGHGEPWQGSPADAAARAREAL